MFLVLGYRKSRREWKALSTSGKNRSTPSDRRRTRDYPPIWKSLACVRKRRTSKPPRLRGCQRHLAYQSRKNPTGRIVPDALWDSGEGS